MWFIGSDLRDRDRLERAAATVGLGVTPSDEAPAVVVIDLDREAIPEVLPTGARLLGYYSHIDPGAAARAEAAGITAIPRGRFWSTLPDALLGPGS